MTCDADRANLRTAKVTRRAYDKRQTKGEPSQEPARATPGYRHLENKYDDGDKCAANAPLHKRLAIGFAPVNLVHDIGIKPADDRPDQDGEQNCSEMSLYDLHFNLVRVIVSGAFEYYAAKVKSCRMGMPAVPWLGRKKTNPRGRAAGVV